MFHLDELLKMKPKINGIENMNALSDGERIGDSPYVVKKTLHRSNDSFVYLAFHSVTDSHVIIKEFFPMIGFEYQNINLRLKRSDYGEVLLPNDEIEGIRAFHQLKRYYKESANYLKGISSEKHLVTVIESFECNNTVYVVLEYLPYPTLDTLMKEKILLPRQVMTIFQMVLIAVESIHKKGYTIKTLKPTNIYISDTHVIIGDFNPLKRSYFISQSSDSKQNPFIAPELLSDSIVNETVDIYNLGKILELFMNHIGYHMMKENVQRSKGFNPGKIDYILSNSMNENPSERLQSVSEIRNLLNHRVVIKNNRIEIVKWFLAAMVVIVAIYSVNRSGIIEMIPWPKEVVVLEESNDVIIQSSNFRFITKRNSFDFMDAKMIRWIDEFDDVYEINLTSDNRHITIVVSDNCIDLDGFGLNPGAYRLSVKNTNMDEIVLDFEIVSKHSKLISAPICDFENYSFYQSASKRMTWTSKTDNLFRIMVYDCTLQEVVYDIKTEQTTLDLDVLNLNRGRYLLSIQEYEEGKESLYDQVNLEIFDDNELKTPIMLIEDGGKLRLGDEIRWQMLSLGDINIRLVHEETGDFVDYSTPSHIGFITLPTEARTGWHHLYVSYTNEQLSSKIVELRVQIVD
ncbi:MAG: protein kinase [Clostridiales bacterium]|nr:protein kinase [Clostridiales bacterium]